MARPARSSLPVASVITVSVGAGVGAVVRHLVELAFADAAESLTLVNLTGSLALGLLVGLLRPTAAGAARTLRHRAFVLLGPGFLGGYTTFSSVMVAVVTSGSPRWVVLLALQVGAGALLALIGLRLGRLLRS